MIIKKDTVFLLDNDSLIGKIVRLIIDRNSSIRDGYDIHQHNMTSTYFPGYDDKKFILIGKIFNESFLKDIKAKDSDFRKIDAIEGKTLNILEELWIETSSDKTITSNESEWLVLFSNVLEDRGHPSTKVLKCYLENFVNILTRGNEFFQKTYLEIENIVTWYNTKQEQPFLTGEKTYISLNKPFEENFIKTNKIQIVLDFEGDDEDKLLLDFYKKYPELKSNFNSLYKVHNEEDISSMLEQKILLESLQILNHEIYTKKINLKNDTINIVNQDIYGELDSVITKTRNRIIIKRNRKKYEQY